LGGGGFPSKKTRQPGGRRIRGIGQMKRIPVAGPSFSGNLEKEILKKKKKRNEQAKAWVLGSPPGVLSNGSW